MSNMYLALEVISSPRHESRNTRIPLDTNPTTFHFFHFRQFFSSFVVIFCFLRLCERWISVDQLCNTCSSFDHDYLYPFMKKERMETKFGLCHRRNDDFLEYLWTWILMALSRDMNTKFEDHPIQLTRGV
ncbi:hypothetical protein RCL_jg18481.t1 [Rhizophagus clarus]|uniref:Uncharacterized protein n=1 Tax=Rhizophagus clarus TaxID=94130 RepID=A0A8H3LJ21_9GLOM|nr:hypothetical protein RCL_jg18481.t1 [Rhizophagus clarus]